MGYPENKKLAKDINTVTSECAGRLGALMTQMSDRMNITNRILEGIAAQEDRRVYRPSTSAGDVVLAAQSASYKRTSENEVTWEEFILPNTFEALYDGEVTVYLSASWRQPNGSFGCGGYTVKQIYPIETTVVTGSLNEGATSSNGSQETSANFSVVKGGVYQIMFTLLSNGSGTSFGSASATADIRSIVQLIEGSNTKYYYPAEGAPNIVDVEGELTVSVSETSSEIYLFTAEVDGAAWINFDVPNGYIQRDTAAYFYIDDSTRRQTIGYIDYYNQPSSSRPWRFTICAGEQYKLRVTCWGSSYITVNNISISAIKTTDFPLILPFKSVENPIAEEITIDGRTYNTAYKLKKLNIPPEAKYLIVSGDGSSIYPSLTMNTLFYDLINDKEDMLIYAYSDGSKKVGGGSLLYTGSNSAYYLTNISGEFYVVGVPTNNQSTKDDIISYCPGISATLY